MKKIKWILLAGGLSVLLFAGVTIFSAESQGTPIDLTPDNIPASSVQQEAVIQPQTAAAPVQVEDDRVSEKPMQEKEPTVSEQPEVPSSAPASESREQPVKPESASVPIRESDDTIRITVHYHGKDYTVTGNDAVTIAALIDRCDYDPDKVCKCLPELTVDTENGEQYGLSLQEAYVRCGQGQADLTKDQVIKLQSVLNCLAPKAAVAE